MTVQVNVYAAGVSRECREAFEDDLSAREPIPRCWVHVCCSQRGDGLSCKNRLVNRTRVCFGAHRLGLALCRDKSRYPRRFPL
jgi:hypothetical protein